MNIGLSDSAYTSCMVYGQLKSGTLNSLMYNQTCDLDMLKQLYVSLKISFKNTDGTLTSNKAMASVFFPPNICSRSFVSWYEGRIALWQQQMHVQSFLL